MDIDGIGIFDNSIDFVRYSFRVHEHVLIHNYQQPRMTDIIISKLGEKIRDMSII